MGLEYFTRRDWAVWNEAYICGYLEGAAAADAQHFAIVDDAARASVRRTAATPPRDVLEERRGNPRQAQELREDWTRRDADLDAHGGWGGAA